VNVIYVKEEHPPKGKESIEWFLMTNEPVNTVEEAYKCVENYMQRWKIERFHYKPYTMKEAVDYLGRLGDLNVLPVTTHRE
jgi:hypothetical protein